MSHDEQLRRIDALDTLGLPRLSVTAEQLRAADADRTPFDVFGWELIGRTGRLCETLVAATGGLRDGSVRGLTLDEAVNAGLLVRLTKLIRALFDSTQSEESEAHQILARCAAETAINLRWLLTFGNADAHKRFRAASYGTFLKISDRIDRDQEDPVIRGTGERVVDYFARELAGAGVERADIPKRPGQWAGSLRARFDDLEEGGLYDVFFGTHSDFVHGSWHESVTFHLRMSPSGYVPDLTFGGLAPPTMYETSRLVLNALLGYASKMPVAGLDAEAHRTVAEMTIEAAIFAELEFARFAASGGIDDQFDRVVVTQQEAAAEAVRRRVEYQAEQTGGAVQDGLPPEAAPAWSQELVRQYNESKKRACPHLHDDPTQPSIWLALLPDLLACQGRECEQRLVPTLEARLGHSLTEEPAKCSACGRLAPVQGVSVGVGNTMIRAMVCAECKGE
jgi:hypothetical protein